MIKPHNIVMLVGFLEVWRVEVQWRSSCKHMFTCRSVYKYLRLLIDQTDKLREPVFGAIGRKSWVMRSDGGLQMIAIQIDSMWFGTLHTTQGMGPTCSAAPSSRICMISHVAGALDHIGRPHHIETSSQIIVFGVVAAGNAEHNSCSIEVMFMDCSHGD